MTQTFPYASLVDRDPWTAVHEPILVASNGTAVCLPALRAAEEIAATRYRRDPASGRWIGAEVRVVSVVDALVVSVNEMTLRSPIGPRERERAEEREAIVRDQLIAFSATAADWPVDVRIGLPAQAIAAEGDALGSPLIVIGLGMHGITDRVFGSETALYVARYGQTPVLSVPPDFTTMPEAMVIAADFSGHSFRAAQAALALFPSITNVHLVHVYSPRNSAGITETVQLTRLMDDLDIPSHIRVTQEALCDDNPPAAILHYSRKIGPSLLVAGSHGRGFFSRLVHGSVSSGILRDAKGPVLIVPPRSNAPRHLVSQWTRGREVASTSWPRLLGDFSTRNTGEYCILEVDDPGMGAQVQVSGQVFIGASYDRHDERITIMTENPEGISLHLTRNIPDVKSVRLAHDGEDREVLQVAHGKGHTLLTIMR